MKKGFTLVELLAVIAILAILVIIALPNIMNMFLSAKKSTFVSEAKIIYGAAEQEYVKDAFSSSGKRVYAKSPEGACAKELDANVKDSLYYYIEIDSSGKVTKFYMYDDSYQYSKEKYDLKKSDIDVNDIEEKDSKEEKMVITCDGVEYVTLINGQETILKTARFITGKELNIKMKTLAGDSITNGNSTVDNNITAIKRSNEEPISPNKEDKNIVSILTSEYPIYMWYEDGTIYWWSESEHPSLNDDSSYIFSYITNLSNIDSLSEFNTSYVKNFERAFYGCSSITSLEALRNWKTSNVTTMYAMFAGYDNFDMHIESLEPLKNWNTSKVTNMQAMFQKNVTLTTLEGLENWDTSKVTTLRNTFYGNISLTTISALRNWNTSSVVNMYQTFISEYSLTTLDGLENWDTSNVVNMAGTFHNVNHLTDASAISNWDVSNVETMSHMFNISNDAGEHHYSELRYMDLSKWYMPNVKNYDWFLESYRWLSTELTIRSTKVESYVSAFQDLANYGGGPVIVNYTNETEELVDKMIATKSSGGNVIKGRLVE